MGKKIQFILFFLDTWFKRHKKQLIISFFTSFLITLALSYLFPYYLNYFGRNHEKIGLIGKFNDKNLPYFIQNQISKGITALDINGETLPSIALSWKIDPDGKRYIFYLRDDLIWHNGKKFTAYDVAYNLKDVKIDKVDQKTLQITLKEPFSPLPVLLSKPLINSNLVGLGDYKVTKVTYSGETIAQIKMQNIKKNLPDITYKFYPTQEDAILGFKRGEIDKLLNIMNIESLQNWKDVTVSEITLYDRYLGLFFNLNNNLFKEKEIRQAIAYAMPEFKDKIRAYSPVSPLSWAYFGNVKIYNSDPETARKILSKSPLSTQSAQLTISTYSSHLSVAQEISQQLNKVGLNTKVKVINSLPSDFEMALLLQNIPSDPDQYQYWQSTQENTNITHYSNLKIDKLLEDGRKTMDREKRKKIYADFQRYLVDDVPVIFLFHPKVWNVERK